MPKLQLSNIQPGLHFISSKKLSRVMKDFNPEQPDRLEPIPNKRLGDEIIYTDGHTRALAAFQQGLSEVPVVMG